jgi:hypothetical protein
VKELQHKPVVMRCEVARKETVRVCLVGDAIELARPGRAQLAGAAASASARFARTVFTPGLATALQRAIRSEGAPAATTAMDNAVDRECPLFVAGGLAPPG